MTDSSIVRFSNESDLEQLKEVSELFEQYIRQIGGDSRYTYEMLQNPVMRTLIAEQDDKINGVISFYNGASVDAGKIYNIAFLFIRPEYRGSRIIMLLFNELKNIAKNEQVKSFIFSVYGQNKNAARLYKRIGAKYMSDENEHFMFLDI
ncbi:MAG: GNAT family N-acetyltransferase [Alphaproteobacteria bacterium]|nr:GNAT family N-acetyltransferase [Alphaproteobacteria bacterium]